MQQLETDLELNQLKFRFDDDEYDVDDDEEYDLEDVENVFLSRNEYSDNVTLHLLDEDPARLAPQHRALLPLSEVGRKYLEEQEKNEKKKKRHDLY
eukprot:UN04032